MVWHVVSILVIVRQLLIIPPQNFCNSLLMNSLPVPVCTLIPEEIENESDHVISCLKLFSGSPALLDKVQASYCTFMILFLSSLLALFSTTPCLSTITLLRVYAQNLTVCHPKAFVHLVLLPGIFCLLLPPS